ncbi:hypothetical protein Unana1_00001 [Umbelopsis nana]
MLISSVFTLVKNRHAGASQIGAWALVISLSLIQLTQAKNVHLDCSATAAGDGSHRTPYNALAEVNALQFAVGNEIVLKAGTFCNGTLSPEGNGHSTNPVHITMYGRGALPIIDAQGAGAAIALVNQGGWHISKVAVTNPAPVISARQGISITATDGQIHTGIYVEHVSVYDVAGETNKATQSEAFKSSPDSPLIDHNVFNDLGGGKYPWTGGNWAGIWVLGSYNAVMEYNIVHNTKMSKFDSEAFDCDWENTGNCTVQYNYGHDNAGGMFLNCDGCGTSGGSVQIV